MAAVAIVVTTVATGGTAVTGAGMTAVAAVTVTNAVVTAAAAPAIRCRR